MFYGSKVEHTIPARGGRDQVLRLVQDLLGQPRLTGAPFTDLDAAARDRAPARSSAARSSSSSRTSSARPAGSGRSTCSTGATRCSRSASSTRARSELPDVGPIIMEDAETGEQLYVDTARRGLPAPVREAARRPARRPSTPRSGGPASRPSTLSTDDDLVRAIVRMATLRRSGGGPGDVVHLADDARSRSCWCPLGRRAYRVARARRRRRSQPRRRPRTRPRGTVPAARAASGPRVPALALRRRARRPDGRPRPAAGDGARCRASEGTVILAFDVSASMAAERPQADPDRGGQGRRDRVRRAPAGGRRHRRRRVQRRRARRSRRRRATRRRCSPRSTG